MADFLKLPFKKWAALNGFNASGNYILMPTVLRNSSLFGAHPQIRFKASCQAAKTSILRWQIILMVEQLWIDLVVDRMILTLVTRFQPFKMTIPIYHSTAQTGEKDLM